MFFGSVTGIYLPGFLCSYNTPIIFLGFPVRGSHFITPFTFARPQTCVTSVTLGFRVQGLGFSPLIQKWVLGFQVQATSGALISKKGLEIPQHSWVPLSRPL